MAKKDTTARATPKGPKAGKSPMTGRFDRAKDARDSKTRKASRIVVQVHKRALRELENH